MADRVDLGHAARLPPRDAIRYFKAKGYKVSWNWWEVWTEAHARAFTVAKAMRLDVLESIRGALDKALERGQTRREFAKEIEPRLRSLGWWGRQFVAAGPGGVERVQLGSPWRLQTIFDTNMRATYGAARAQAQAANAGSRPYLLYSSRRDSRVRPAHAALDGAVFRAGDPIWNTHYPPNGWNCRCRVRALTERQVIARGGQVRDTRRGDGELREVMQKAGVDKRTGEEIRRPGTAYSWTDPVTGERRTLLPDPGWSYNPGRPGGQGRLAVPPPEPAGRPRRPATGADARREIVDAAAPIRRRRAEQEQRLRNDPGDRAIIGDLDREARATALRRIERDEPASWAHGAMPEWEDDQVRRQWETEAGTWHRMVSPTLLRQLRPPSILRAPEGQLSSSSFGWLGRTIRMEVATAPAGTMAHELSHILEANPATLRAAGRFLHRRTAGDPIVVVNSRGDLGRRDRWRNPAGDPDYYPGRLYSHDELHEGDTRHVDVDATEVLSQGMQWMYQDPVGFAEQDPEYFDFIWDTVLGGD